MSKILLRHANGVLVAVCAALLVAATTVTTALAQDEKAATKPAEVDRGGFTLLLTMGLGLQNNGWIEESGVGLGGLNLGIGGFVSPDLAVMFRASGTNVDFDRSKYFNVSTNFVSGVGGVSVQYWANNVVNLEGGAGFAFANADPGPDDSGFGLIAAIGFSFWHKGKHSLQFGIEYAPVFLDSGNVHNVCFTFGWQLL